MALTGAVLVLATTPAWAAAPRVRVGLDYQREQGAEVCPDAAAFHRRTVAIFGRDPIADITDPLLVVELRRQGLVVVANATVLDEGAVVWSAESRAPVGECSDLVDGVALAVKTALEHDPPGEAPRAPVRLPAPIDARSPQIASAIPTAQPVHFGLGVNFAAYWWSYPLPAFAFGASAEIRFRAFSLGMEGAYVMPSNFGFYTVQALLSSNSVCVHHSILFGCGVFTIGHALLEGGDETTPGTISTIGPRLGLDLPLSARFRLRVRGDLASRIAPYLGWYDQRPIKAPPPWSVGAALGVVAIF